MAAGPNRDDGNIIEQQDLERSIRNLFHCRDGKSEYAMYFTFELPILYAEFVDRNRHVITDCSHEVLSARVQTIEENELAPTSEIVRLEEAIVDEAIDILNNKRELLETLKEELISYKARCGRFRERINNRLGEVNARRAAQAAIARVQETPMDLSRGNRQEVVRERIEQEASLPIVRLRRFDQDQPQIIIQRCDAPARQPQPDPQPPVIPPAENIMAEEQQLNIELEEHAEPEVEMIEPDEVVMEIEDYSIDSTESTDGENDGEIDEVENAIYDQAINEFEAAQNAGNVGQDVHDWAEEVLANEIAQNVQQAQPPPQNVQPEVQAQQRNAEPIVRMNPLPQPIGWNNTRFGLEAVQVLRDYGRDVIVRMRLHEDRAEKAMIHLSTDVRETFTENGLSCNGPGSIPMRLEPVLVLYRTFSVRWMGHRSCIRDSEDSTRCAYFRM